MFDSKKQERPLLKVEKSKNKSDVINQSAHTQTNPQANSNFLSLYLLNNGHSIW